MYGQANVFVVVVVDASVTPIATSSPRLFSDVSWGGGGGPHSRITYSQIDVCCLTRLVGTCMMVGRPSYCDEATAGKSYSGAKTAHGVTLDGC